MKGGKEKAEVVGDFVTLKSCIISFMHTTQDFFIQDKFFDSEIAKIQPLIEDCFDPFDLSERNLCVAQWKDDEQFYRMRILNWMEEKNEAYAEMIDYGNRTNVSIDTVTRLADNLVNFKPLAINCSLPSVLLVVIESKEYAEFINLVTCEVPFDCVIKNNDLEAFYASNGKFVCPVELFFSSNGLRVDGNTLSDFKLLNKLKRHKEDFLKEQGEIVIDGKCIFLKT